MSTVEEAEKAVEVVSPLWHVLSVIALVSQLFVPISFRHSGFCYCFGFLEQDLNGRLLTVNKAAARGSQPPRPRVYETANRIYVGNLPWQVDDARLEQVFSEYGKVVNARVVSDRETGRSRGFGFVTMSSETEVNDAIAALDGQGGGYIQSVNTISDKVSLDGRAIRVNVAEERRRGSF
ncbi:hypothetical protein Patl1_02883 [Pistacia atlantica]|uniref:Uncharacterized protein n=1 Tax=Pistacia atlantica TaxID=434234 RepID=A0ACC1CD74_9ROSI|nr:hypothetical protein Patl1_02883 [Pistacia atlantica]